MHRQKRRMDRARDALILANLRLVIFVARRYVREGVSLMDLIQEGNLGLIKAVEKFDHRLGNRFSTYAYWWIQQTIDRAITVKWRAVRVPVYLVTASRRIRRAAETLRRRLGREPTAEEVARHVGRSVREVETIASSAKVLPEELDAVGRDQVPRPDAPDVSPETPERGVEVREARELVRRALQTLTPRERKVVRLRFGIGGTEPGTLQQVGEVLHLSRERVRQIESAALNKLRASPPGPLRALPRAGEVARRAAAGA